MAKQCVYIDVSGSMGNDRLQRAQEIAETLGGDKFIFDTRGVRPMPEYFPNGGGCGLKGVVPHAKSIGATEIHVITDGKVILNELGDYNTELVEICHEMVDQQKKRTIDSIHCELHVV